MRRGANMWFPWRRGFRMRDCNLSPHGFILFAPRRSYAQWEPRAFLVRAHAGTSYIRASARLQWQVTTLLGIPLFPTDGDFFRVKTSSGRPYGFSHARGAARRKKHIQCWQKIRALRGFSKFFSFFNFSVFSLSSIYQNLWHTCFQVDTCHVISEQWWSPLLIRYFAAIKTNFKSISSESGVMTVGNFTKPKWGFFSLGWR